MYSCPMCGHAFNRKSDMERHTRTYHSSMTQVKREGGGGREDGIDCSGDTSFLNDVGADDTARNKTMVANIQLKCSICHGTDFQDLRLIARHFKNKHQQNSIRCALEEVEGRLFLTVSPLEDADPKHEMRFCKYTDTSQQFLCSFCSKTLLQLTMHYRHDHIQVNKCQHCGEVFKNRYNMDRHVKRVHNVDSANVSVKQEYLVPEMDIMEGDNDNDNDYEDGIAQNFCQVEMDRDGQDLGGSTRLPYPAQMDQTRCLA